LVGCRRATPIGEGEGGGEAVDRFDRGSTCRHPLSLCHTHSCADRGLCGSGFRECGDGPETQWPTAMCVHSWPPPPPSSPWGRCTTPRAPRSTPSGTAAGGASCTSPIPPPRGGGGPRARDPKVYGNQGHGCLEWLHYCMLRNFPDPPLPLRSTVLYTYDSLLKDSTAGGALYSLPPGQHLDRP